MYDQKNSKKKNTKKNPTNSWKQYNMFTHITRTKYFKICVQTQKTSICQSNY